METKTRKRTVDHTPGPWEVDPLNIGSPWNVGTKDDEIALAQQLRGDDLKQSRRSTNARLIAAAPDLLAACQEYVKVRDASRFAPHDWEQVYGMVKNAIRKAEADA